MAVSRHSVVAGQPPVGKVSEAASMAELVDVILDKGIAIDAWTRVSVLGLELLTLETRMLVTSVETYLRYADAIACITPAAPPPVQRAVSGRENEQDRVLEGEVLRRLSEHPEGLPSASLQALLDAPRERVNEILDHLTEGQKVRRDEEHDLYHHEGR
jgi:hypothetical protein